MLADFYCSTCETLLEDQLIKSEEAEKPKDCPICKTATMIRIPYYSNRINMVGYSYSNGYSTKG